MTIQNTHDTFERLAVFGPKVTKGTNPSSQIRQWAIYCTRQYIYNRERKKKSMPAAHRNAATAGVSLRGVASERQVIMFVHYSARSAFARNVQFLRRFSSYFFLSSLANIYKRTSSKPTTVSANRMATNVLIYTYIYRFYRVYTAHPRVS